MRRASIRTLIPAGILLLSLLPSSPAAEAPQENPHAHFRLSDQCPKCHSAPGRFAESSVDFCLACHPIDEQGRSHVFRGAPRLKARTVAVPKGLPLSGNGRIMCLTCHTAHGPFLEKVPAFSGQVPEKAEGAAGSPSLYRTFFLRRSDPSRHGFEALCRECHGAL